MTAGETAKAVVSAPKRAYRAEPVRMAAAVMATWNVIVMVARFDPVVAGAINAALAAWLAVFVRDDVVPKG